MNNNRLLFIPNAMKPVYFKVFYPFYSYILYNKEEGY